MRRTFASILFLFLSVYTHAQVTISGQVKGIRQPQVLVINAPFDCWYYKQLSQLVHTDKSGYFSVMVDVPGAQTIFAEYMGQRMLLYVEPGKHVSFSFDSTDLMHTIQFNGQLKTENDFRSRVGLNFFTLYNRQWDDSLASPEDMVPAIQNDQERALQELNRLRKIVSKDFLAVTGADIQYFLPGIIWNIIFKRSDALRKDKAAWQEALQTAYRQQPLSNPDATKSYYYQNMLAYYPRYLELAASGKESLDSLLEAVLKKPASAALREIQDKGKRFWTHQAISFGLQGQALEYALASFVINGVYSGELDYLQEAYGDFLSRFPQSMYRSRVERVMSSYLASQSDKSGNDIILEPTSHTFNSLHTILQQHKGRVVYIDLWGSWCGPCKEEFAYSNSLKAYFKGKPVDFLYLAFEHNRGDPEAIWKKTVKFYALAGRHILAGEALKADIGKLYGPEGVQSFPSYLLIDKEGTVQSLFAERPSAGDKLYKQIEQFLK